MRAAPIRTCVGCGTRVPQEMLVRIVAEGGELKPDPARRALGRGGYLHARAACWQEFARRRGGVRSLRLTPTPLARARLVAALAVDRTEAWGGPR